MSNLQTVKQQVATTRIRPMSTQVAEVRQNINLIHETMKSTMKDGVHYGMIPGCPKKSLFKPGAEVIMTLFKLSSDPIITDLSKDGEIRYQVKVNVTTRDGVFIGAGIGECSSGEEKYMWRVAICDEEFAATLEVNRRIKFRKDRYSAAVTQIQQVRVAPSDMANTILKMAKKRALIDAVLTATAASDIFSQDIEDLPEGYIEPEKPAPVVIVDRVVPSIVPTTPKVVEPKDAVWPDEEVEWPETSGNAVDIRPQDAPRSSAEPANFNDQPQNGHTDVPAQKGVVISVPQQRRLYAIAKGSGIQDLGHWLKANFKIEKSSEILRSQYEEICKAAEGYKSWFFSPIRVIDLIPKPTGQTEVFGGEK